MAVGTAIGLVAGLAPGRAAGVLMRAMDALLVFPSLVLALTITAFLGASLWNVIGALAVTFIPTFAFLVRGEVLALGTRDFVTAARPSGPRVIASCGGTSCRISSDVLLVQSSFGIGTAILTEASLSFLGSGCRRPRLSWGRMLREGYSFLLEAPWLSVAAGGAIFLIALASQMVADGLQVVLAAAGPARVLPAPTACPRSLRRPCPGRLFAADRTD